MKIADIRIPSHRRRPLGDVANLVDSIREVGLLQPVTVGLDGTLIAGLHRVEACRQLGWVDIPANQVDLDSLDARLAEIDENLIRNELTVLERSEHLRERKALYLEKHPETGPGGDRTEQTETISVCSVPTFTEDTAAKVGQSSRNIRAEVQIAEDLSDETKATVRGTLLEDKKVDLLNLARVKDPVEQHALAEKIVSGEAKNVAAAKQQLAREKRQSEAKPIRRDGYRIIEGEAVEKVASLVPGSVDLVVTDPPYGIDTHRTREGGHDYADGEDYALDLLDRLAAALVTKCSKTAHLYFFSGYTHEARFKEILSRYFDVQDNPIIWVKNRQTIADATQKYANRHEYIWFCRMRGSKRVLSKPSSDVLEYATQRDTGHSAEKPVELLKFLVSQSSVPGELVLDPFCGSGSTGVAAAALGRAFIGIELDPKWAGVASGRTE